MVSQVNNSVSSESSEDEFKKKIVTQKDRTKSKIKYRSCPSKVNIGTVTYPSLNWSPKPFLGEAASFCDVSEERGCRILWNSAKTKGNRL